ncbi:DUF6461 domain-containing protein [Streptomyces yunnanensis]|uniref:Uncharacterized protein n=1 Tax=Streptomyces yunnanensis TaxID=156453 RepID=A0A9X8MXF2_9ACTN|nr:DUF6461 domain-containing protein [Streptomyces yunnanensis]SHM19561.1 hypothetical protein SAMN05216268_10980 [Streptomyces yunnanensis]
MSDGIQGLIDREDDWYHHVIFARGITPEGLAPRRGGRPGSVPSPITADEAEALTGDYGTDDEDLIRISSSGAWSIALEYGLPTGRERLAEISRDEVEVVHLDPQPDHPPKMFAYARNGVEVCSFGIGEEDTRWGEQPDFLLPELAQAGVLTPDGESARPEDEPYRDRDRATLAVLEARFGLCLPPGLEQQPLPAFVIP